MKKLTTAATNGIEKLQGLTIGLDLGDRSSHYCVLDEKGRILVESKVSTSPNAIKEVFGSKPRSRIAVETGMHSPWVSRLLSGLGHEVIVAHARNVAGAKTIAWMRRRWLVWPGSIRSCCLQ